MYVGILLSFQFSKVCFWCIYEDVAMYASMWVQRPKYTFDWTTIWEICYKSLLQELYKFSYWSINVFGNKTIFESFCRGGGGQMRVVRLYLKIYCKWFSSIDHNLMVFWLTLKTKYECYTLHFQSRTYYGFYYFFLKFSAIFFIFLNQTLPLLFYLIQMMTPWNGIWNSVCHCYRSWLEMMFYKRKRVNKGTRRKKKKSSV